MLLLLVYIFIKSRYEMFYAKIYLFESDLYVHKCFYYNFFLSMHKTLNDSTNNSILFENGEAFY